MDFPFVILFLNKKFDVLFGQQKPQQDFYDIKPYQNIFKVTGKMGKVHGRYAYNHEKPEIIYVYDALCGWCYGFSSVIQQLHAEFCNRTDFLVLSGGMIRNENAGPIGEVAGYIKNAYKQVEDYTGVKFGKKFLEDVLEKGDALFSSVPPAKALAVFRLEHATKSVQFVTCLQKAIYYDGMLINNYAGYGKIAASFGLDPAGFIQRMQSEEINQIVINEFKMVAGLGVDAYPMLFLRKGDDIKKLAKGYTDYKTIADQLTQVLA